MTVPVRRAGQHELVLTSLQGYVTTTYAHLIRAFGEPHDRDVAGKIRVQWRLRFADGTVASVYDWKTSEPIDEVTEWNVGGSSPHAVRRVQEVLR